MVTRKLRHRTDSAIAPALVMGDIDLVQALALEGIPSGVFAEPRAPVRLSRHVVASLPWHDGWREPDATVESLLSFAAASPLPPVLFAQTDGDLLAVSRNRRRLDGPLRMLLAAEDLVEAAIDKSAFAQLAARLSLPVPPSRAVDPSRSSPDLDLRFPLVLKPLLREAAAWSAVEASAKAVHVETAEEMSRLWPQLCEAGVPVLAQEAIPGDETRMESYHGYFDADGAAVAEFTGRKIRTLPVRYGHSSALELTAEEDVMRAGREVSERLGVRGVVKADFKRDARGRLWLLEVNPRFTLWHHLAAKAGMNVPALYHADVTGRPRPAFGPVRPGARWVQPSYDVRAARQVGVPLGAWLRWARGCDAVSGLSASDPLPFFPGVLWAPVARRVEALR
jgi:predicted ATP-grasp superfamily ATP-dependent carboligase